MDRSERHRLSFGLFSSGPIFIRRCSPGLVVDPLVGGWRWPTGRARHRSSEQLGTAETKKGLKRVFCALIVTIICAGSAVADADHRGAAGHGWPSWPARPHHVHSSASPNAHRSNSVCFFFLAYSDTGAYGSPSYLTSPRRADREMICLISKTQ